MKAEATRLLQGKPLRSVEYVSDNRRRFAQFVHDEVHSGNGFLGSTPIQAVLNASVALSKQSNQAIGGIVADYYLASKALEAGGLALKGLNHKLSQWLDSVFSESIRQLR